MIEIFNTNSKNRTIVEKTAIAVLHHFNMSEQDIDVEIDFLSEAEIRALNKESREVDAVTDVLSFQNLDIAFPFEKDDYPEDRNPETDAVILGEICICLSRATAQAKELEHGILRELSFLTCHGMLHLLGFDHMEPEDEEAMTAKQREIVGTAEDEATLMARLDAACNQPVSACKPAKTEKNDGEETEEETDEEDIDDENDDDEDCEEEDDGEDIDEDNDSEPLKSKKADNDSAVAGEEKPVKAGYIAVLGKPNAGKSTLINALVGEKVSIVSWKPQTTRNSIMGIYNDSDTQIVFIDTPGLHAPQNTLGKYMMHGVTAALNETDFVLYVVDGERGLREEDAKNIARYLEGGKKVAVAVNKIDHITKEKVMEILDALTPIVGISTVVPISAVKEKNLDTLLQELKKLLPLEAGRMFDEELYTTQNMRFMASEVIREKALRLLDDEIPYGIGVNINKYEYRPNGILDIDADVVLENKKHKPIVLGKGGQMIKKISTYAREDLEKITDCKIMLTLWVRVKEEWRDNPTLLDDMGYAKKKNDLG